MPVSHFKSCSFAIALIALSTSTSWALSDKESKHLLLRAGFGAQPELMEKLATTDRARAVNFLLDQPSSFQAPASCVLQALPNRKMRKAWSNKERIAARKAMRVCGAEFKTWYLQQLIADPAVLVNKMALFWHNHFTSSIKKVKAVPLIYAQHTKIQTLAVGNFAELLKAMVNDPAMLIYLDNINNSKAKPNENLARELLELFTLGEGNYTEQDVLSAARALTGLSVERNKYQRIFRHNRHDNSQKVIFEQQLINDSDDLIQAILNNPDTAIHITRSIWMHFISSVNERQIERLADDFSRDWDIKKLLKSILLSPDFWQDGGQMFKSPIELVVGSAKLFQLEGLASKRTVKRLSKMGQNLFDPPNVKGWPRGENWIDENKLILRSQFTDQLARAVASNMAEMTAIYCSAEQMVNLTAVAALSLSTSTEGMLRQCPQQLTDLITDPSWQLK